MSTISSSSKTATTQTKQPWRATIRTVFQALVAFSAMWAIVVEAIGLDPGWQWVSASLAVTGAITRVMALPQVEQFLRRFVPLLAADRDDPGWTLDGDGAAEFNDGRITRGDIQ